MVNVLLGEPEAASKAVAASLSMANAVASARVNDRLQRTTRLAQVKFPGVQTIGELADRSLALTSRSNHTRG